VKPARYSNSAAPAQVIYTKHSFDQELFFRYSFASFPKPNASRTIRTPSEQCDVIALRGRMSSEDACPPDKGESMNERQPSRTALGAAGYRAAHQVLEGGKVFSDPLARTILGDGADAIIAGISADPAQQRMRIFMAARSRFAEDSLGAAVSRGVRQAVVLGAGFDTFALRNPYSNLGLRVFEVDHPATQAWKRRRLSEVGLTIPASLTFAAIDFDSDDLGHGLRDAGFDPDHPAFFIWLGVVPWASHHSGYAALHCERSGIRGGVRL
jgi:hypothetical protein